VVDAVPRDLRAADVSGFVLRFVQEYAVGDRDAFLELEARFAEMERRRPDWPQGRRTQPYAGAEPTNALVWEAPFPTLADALAALERIAGDEEHEALFREQAPLITRARTEIYETLDL
jgi:hypothetical protein